jgi:hypothetical protein
VWIDDLDAEGKPIMDERFVNPRPRRHIEWTPKSRMVSPWVAIGPGITSEQLNQRLNPKD